MARKLYENLEGWPAVAISGMLLALVAYFGTKSYQNLQAEMTQTLAQLEEAHEENIGLIKEVREKEEVIGSFEGQIKGISSTVGTLEKLSQTDEELLKKYSKVYFLNENYVPPAFSDIEEKYLLPSSKNFMIYAKVYPYLRDLLDASRSAGQDLLIASAFRSFETQAALKGGYKVIYGSGANQFSADQGYSEHQLGTSIDFTTLKLGANFSQFGSSSAYEWLRNNAHKYGFILSYPPNNAFYKFEPWHWRFVGKELAIKLHDEDKYFYDLDQREIDKYLIKIFD